MIKLIVKILASKQGIPKKKKKGLIICSVRKVSNSNREKLKSQTNTFKRRFLQQPNRKEKNKSLKRKEKQTDLRFLEKEENLGLLTKTKETLEFGN